MNVDVFDHWLLQHAVEPGYYVGLDIGGANLKYVGLLVTETNLRVQRATSQPFALWKEPENLATALETLLEPIPSHAILSITMTGEIADCFETKQAGVEAIVSSCERTCAKLGLSASYYAQANMDRDQHDSTRYPRCSLFYSASQAVANPLCVAASNWHSVATLFGDFLVSREKSSGLLLDLGSTTFDLTPVLAESQMIRPATDWERIQAGQLIYSGVGRSPLACLVPEFTDDRGRPLSLAQELFATARDAYLLTGDDMEAVDCCNTADGRPATKPFARQRIARMLCSDTSELPADLPEKIAVKAKANQMSNFRVAIVRQMQKVSNCAWIAVCGQGESQLVQLIAEYFPQVRLIRLSDFHGHGCSLAAPAFATAVNRALIGRDLF